MKLKGWTYCFHRHVLSKSLKKKYFPRLVEIVVLEYSYSHNTLLNFLQLLFFYDEITFNCKKENIHDPKLISMLPILVNITEKLIEKSEKYREYAD